MKNIKKIASTLMLSAISLASYANPAAAITPVAQQTQAQPTKVANENIPAEDKTAANAFVTAIANQPGWIALNKIEKFNTWHINYTLHVTENKPKGKTIFHQKMSTLGTATAAFSQEQLTPYISKVEVTDGKKPKYSKELYREVSQARVETRMVEGELLSFVEMNFSLGESAFRKSLNKIGDQKVIIDIPDATGTERVSISKTFSYRMEDIESKPLKIVISESPEMIVELEISRS